ncbi:MAG TPA: hypothetical protein VFU31_18820 [Candidatus Binatia bacterium]|nr:hypothetical protein [Candidatus Binatia bacterium]
MACHARTGLFTPPGIFFCAALKSCFDRCADIGELEVTLTLKRVKLESQKNKSLLPAFFVAKKYEKDYDTSFGVVGETFFV